MPDGVRLGPAFTQVRRNGGPEMVDPAAHRLMGHHDPALSQQILDIPEAQREPDAQLDHVLDDPGRKAVSAVADLGHHSWLTLQVSAGKPGT